MCLLTDAPPPLTLWMLVLPTHTSGMDLSVAGGLVNSPSPAGGLASWPPTWGRMLPSAAPPGLRGLATCSRESLGGAPAHGHNTQPPFPYCTRSSWPGAQLYITLTCRGGGLPTHPESRLAVMAHRPNYYPAWHLLWHTWLGLSVAVAVCQVDHPGPRASGFVWQLSEQPPGLLMRLHLYWVDPR